VWRLSSTQFNSLSSFHSQKHSTQWGVWRLSSTQFNSLSSFHSQKHSTRWGLSVARSSGSLTNTLHAYDHGPRFISNTVWRTSFERYRRNQIQLATRTRSTFPHSTPSTLSLNNQLIEQLRRNRRIRPNRRTPRRTERIPVKRRRRTLISAASSGIRASCFDEPTSAVTTRWPSARLATNQTAAAGSQSAIAS